MVVQEAMRGGIPDGWAAQIRNSVPPERWRALSALLDVWLKANPSHVLAPLVTLSRVRLAYFSGDNALAWDALLSLYPRHLPRLVGEMRYLAAHGMIPPTLDDPRIDARLRAALLTMVSPDDVHWNRWWEESQAHRGDRAALATQERLLWHAARDAAGGDSSLPAAFPRAAATPSPLWARLRLVALASAGRDRDALAQAQRMPRDSVAALVETRIRLVAGDWRGALSRAALDADARRYLTRVVAPDGELPGLATVADPIVRDEARLALATRARERSGWTAGAALLGSRDSARSRLWRRGALLAPDTTLAGRLTYARWLRDANAHLFYPLDKSWHRSVDGRYFALGDTVTDLRATWRFPWTPGDERLAIARHLRATTGMYLALRVFVDALERAPVASRRAIARESDGIYNWLINYDSNNSRFWVAELATSGIGQRLRKAARP